MISHSDDSIDPNDIPKNSMVEEAYKEFCTYRKISQYGDNVPEDSSFEEAYKEFCKKCLRHDFHGKCKKNNYLDTTVIANEYMLCTSCYSEMRRGDMKNFCSLILIAVLILAAMIRYV